MYKLMVVNDDDLEVRAIKIILELLKNDIKVVGVTQSGKEAIKLNDKLQPDIIILGDDIPGISTLKAIKENDKEKIVIIIKGCSNFYFNREKSQSNWDYYLLRPIEEDDLINTLQQGIIKLRTNKNRIKENEFLLLDTIICGEEKECEKLLQELIKSYVLICNNNIDIFKEKAIGLVTSIVKISHNIKIQTEQEKYIASIEGKKNLDSIKQVVNILLIKIFDQNQGKSITEKLTQGKNINKNLKPVFEYIEKNYRDKITLEEAANMCNLNKYYFSKLFKKSTSIKFVDYITLYKIERAKEILKNTDECIINIAIELGYDESGYFSKVFKKIVGVTPSTYRNKNN
ncbi:AraC family transcriptional regulator [Clostridium botulinum]|uniref:Stage 0 sporulation protein A homolog n=1 Tax=Clostridium botulinum C/D str. DC5 TaxID=1443128 RepID=A0A0A0IFD2_CLOBO|nr:helix-turn-helix domain-containing protein [Clostridium botulinum]KGM99687.1 AraC family transcriptional regulator [Clostridium botulinum C/D str. DC5]MCD3234076.1 AraC family transcriptional regulator [Clostridium botulinum D/C]MCD3239913.1 AraC family transcriptional regulator [Clostridium botulinum D/C]MCD3267435.1 AraC family transcriptional regulator [Clostridium botulinum D/C]MCD3299893.1 AraC family transcriptional regulator [Clostridium botulinum D/C]